MTNISQVTVDSLHPFYTYLCQVRAETVQPGPFSGVISILLLEQGEVQLYVFVVRLGVFSRHFIFRGKMLMLDWGGGGGGGGGGGIPG